MSEIDLAENPPLINIGKYIQNLRFHGTTQVKKVETQQQSIWFAAASSLE